MSESTRRPRPLWGVARHVLALAAIWAAVVVAPAGCDSREVAKIDLRDRIDDAELAKMAPRRDSEGLRFGFDPRGFPDEDARQYLPFLRYLEAATGLRFELRFTPKNRAIADELGVGNLQFAAVGAETYICARARYGVIPVARGLNAEGRAEYRSVIVVAPDSPLREVEELRGKRLAFGGATSTQGYLIPRIILQEHGMSLSDLARYEHTGSHQDCASAVAAGLFDAGGMQDVLGRRLADEGLLRIIHTSDLFPSSGIAANKDVPHEVIENVKRAMLDFHPTGVHSEGLYHWDRTEMARGFGEAHDEDYAKLREWSNRFERLANSTREAAP